jgi:hypothetical protein
MRMKMRGHWRPVAEHGGAALAEIEAARVDFGERRDEARRRPPLVHGERFERRQQILVGSCLECVMSVCHSPCVALRFLPREDSRQATIDMSRGSMRPIEYYGAL